MNYLSHPLNYLNNLFYSQCPEAFTTSGLADFFVKVEPVQEAIYRQLTHLFPHPHIRLKEICAGARPDRWDYLYQEHPDLPWDITLSDFSPSSLPQNYPTVIENILLPISSLHMSLKYDVILTTYGFDSLWYPTDVHYQKTNGMWSKTILGFPSRLPSGSSLIDLSQFSPTQKSQTVTIETEPYGKDIFTYYQKSDNVSFNFPGGLISYVQEVFTKQLKPGGVFLSGDLAAGEDNLASVKLHQPPFETIGRVAKFHSSDYGLAKYVLEKLGFQVDLYSVNDLLAKWDLSIPLDLSDHLFLQISKT